MLPKRALAGPAFADFVLGRLAGPALAFRAAGPPLAFKPSGAPPFALKVGGTPAFAFSPGATPVLVFGIAGLMRALFGKLFGPGIRRFGIVAAFGEPTPGRLAKPGRIGTPAGPLAPGTPTMPRGARTGALPAGGFFRFFSLFRTRRSGSCA